MPQDDTVAEIPPLLPQPRLIEKRDGTTQLSSDLRLATSNVLPYVRKTMRSILAAADIRVVANKKKFVVNVNIVSEDELDYGGVPEGARDDYSEITVENNVVTVCSAAQAGAVWGTQTFANIYQALGPEVVIPNMRIRDWSTIGSRGVFLESGWGLERMPLDGWYRWLDWLARCKMSFLGVELWGHAPFSAGEKPGEFLLVPFPDEPEFASENTLEWYSPAHGAWVTDASPPIMAQNDFLTNLMARAKEKGVSFIPGTSLLGENTLIPRVYEEVAAKDGGGRPTRSGWCLAGDASRERIEQIYSSLFERYFPNGMDYFHIRIENLPDADDSAAWCQCEQCAKHSPTENVVEFVTWLGEMLVAKGVKRLVLQSDQLSAGLDLLAAGLLEQLKKAELVDRLTVRWRGEFPDADTVGALRNANIDLWLGPVAGLPDWTAYTSAYQCIPDVVNRAQNEEPEGIMPSIASDPAAVPYPFMLAHLSWLGDEKVDLAEAQPECFRAFFGAEGDAIEKAHRQLTGAAAECPPLAACYPSVHVAAESGAAHYPFSALETLEENDFETVRKQLQDAGTRAGEAVDALKELQSRIEDIQAKNAEEETEVSLPPPADPALVGSLIAEGHRLIGLSEAFIQLMIARQDIEGQGNMDAAKSALAVAHEVLTEAMKGIETYKPGYLQPPELHGMSLVLKLIQRLQKEAG